MPKLGIRFSFGDKIITYIFDDNLLTFISLITSFALSTTIKLSIKKNLLKRQQMLETEQILERIKLFLRKILITLSVLLIERKRINEKKEKLNQLRGGDNIVKCLDPLKSYEVVDDGIATVIKEIIVRDWPKGTAIIFVAAPVFIVGAMAKKLLKQNLFDGSKILTNLVLFGTQVMFEDMKVSIIRATFAVVMGASLPLVWPLLVPFIPVLQGLPVLANYFNMTTLAAVILATTISYTVILGITDGYTCKDILRELPTFERVADQSPFYIDLPNPGQQKVIITADEPESRPTPIYMQDPKTEASQTCQATQGTVGSQKSVQVQCQKTAQYVPLEQRTKTLADLKNDSLVNEARDKSSSSIERYESRREKIMNSRGK